MKLINVKKIKKKPKEYNYLKNIESICFEENPMIINNNSISLEINNNTHKNDINKNYI